MRRALSALLLAWSLPTAWAGAVADWGGASGAASGAIAQVQRFTRDGVGVSADFAARFVAQAQREALAAADRFAQGTGSCSPSSRVRFPGDQASGAAVEVAFQQHLFLVETVHCAPHPSPSEVARVYVSGDFRKATMPNLDAYSTTTTRTCMSTAGSYGLIAPTALCMRHRTLDSPTLYVEHAVLESNGDDASLQPVFYRDSTIVVVPRPLQDGTEGVAIYRRVLTRGPEVSSLGRAVLGRTTAATSAKVDGELARRLAAR
jgi:hypothetical protein